MTLPDKPVPVSNEGKKGKIVRLYVDRDLCIGAASCVVVYPQVFEMDDENKAVMLLKDGGKTSEMTNVTALNVEELDDDMLLMAAQSCPTLAVFLYDGEGNQIYPIG